MKKIEKPIHWSVEKNELLRKERGICFEDIVKALETDALVDSYPHPKIKHQKIFEVLINSYVITVPYVEDDKKIFLKTAFHSRKATKKIKGEKNA